MRRGVMPRRREKERRKFVGPIRCPGHRTWVKTEWHCAIEGRTPVIEAGAPITPTKHECWGPIDAHHVVTQGAGGGDEQIIPLCRGAHSLLDSPWWSGPLFEQRFGINMEEMAANLWQESDAGKRYRAMQRRA